MVDPAHARASVDQLRQAAPEHDPTGYRSHTLLCRMKRGAGEPCPSWCSCQCHEVGA